MRVQKAMEPGATIVPAGLLRKSAKPRTTPIHVPSTALQKPGEQPRNRGSSLLTIHYTYRSKYEFPFRRRPIDRSQDSCKVGDPCQIWGCYPNEEIWNGNSGTSR